MKKKIVIPVPVPVSDFLLTLLFAILLFMSWTLFSKNLLPENFVKLDTIYLIIIAIVLVFFFHAAANGKLTNKISNKPTEFKLDEVKDEIEDEIKKDEKNATKKKPQQKKIDKNMINLDKEIKKRGTFRYDLTGNIKPYDIHT